MSLNLASGPVISGKRRASARVQSPIALHRTVRRRAARGIPGPEKNKEIPASPQVGGALVLSFSEKVLQLESGDNDFLTLDVLHMKGKENI